MSSKKANGEGTIYYSDSKDLWIAQVTTSTNPATGKPVRKTIYGKTKSEVRAKMTKILSDLDNGTYREPSKLTVSQWFDMWIDTYNSGVKVNTLERYRCDIRNHIKPSLGALQLAKVNPTTVQMFYNALLEKGISPKSIKNIHGVLHKSFEKAVLLQYIPTNPCIGCELPRIEKHEIKPIEGNSIKAFIQAIENDRFRNIFYVDMFSGLRQSEIIGLTWDCIDFEKHTIKVYRQLIKQRHFQKGCEWHFAPLKNDKERTITVSKAVLDILRTIHKEQNENKLASGGVWTNEKDLVFVDDAGKHLCAMTVYTHFKACAARAQIPDTRFHDLRHTFATLSLQNGDDIKTVSENLGHATVAFTLDVYGHVTDKMRQESADRMQALIESI